MSNNDLRQVSLHDEMAAYAPQLLSIAYKMGVPESDRNDLVQETLLRAFEKANLFRAASNPDHENELHVWLIRILRNYYISELRKKDPLVGHTSRKTPLPEEDQLISAHFIDSHHLTLEAIAHHQYLERLERYANARDLQIFKMQFFYGMSHEEIGNALGMSEKAVKSRVHHAKAEARNILNGSLVHRARRDGGISAGLSADMSL